MEFCDLIPEERLKNSLYHLNEYLESRSYIEDCRPTTADALIFNTIVARFPHIFRWYSHIKSFAKEELSNLPFDFNLDIPDFDGSENSSYQSLNAYLADRSYMVAYHPTIADFWVIEAFPHFFRWYSHINSIPEKKRKQWSKDFKSILREYRDLANKYYSGWKTNQCSKNVIPQIHIPKDANPWQQDINLQGEKAEQKVKIILNSNYSISDIDSSLSCLNDFLSIFIL